MKTILGGTLAVLASVAFAGQAHAWASANRAGGSTSHSYGSHEPRKPLGRQLVRTKPARERSHSNVYGGSSAHAYGGGTEHTNMYGGSTYGKYGSGAYHTYPSGATAYHPPGYPAYPTYPVYHPPVAVPYYSSGCYGCAAAAGAVVGMAAGAAVASANTAAATSSAYSAGVAAGSANTAAATTAAYAAGVAAGVTAAAPPVGYLGHGHELRDDSRRMRHAERRRQYVLPLRQHVVQAVVRRQRRVLHRRADAVAATNAMPRKQRQ